MTEYLIVDRNGLPLQYRGTVITFPSRERARAFCVGQCNLVPLGDEQDVVQTDYAATFRRRYELSS